ncbi:MAG: dihydrofolate reductase [Candidatus Omnitrophota bacterium]
MKPFSIVVAFDEQNGIGRKGNLPWHLSSDLKHFKEITTKTNDSSKNNAVIMGRKTWDSLPLKYKPLPNRLNVILTRMNPDVYSGLYPTGEIASYQSLDAAIDEVGLNSQIEQIFIIGGGQIFTEAINHRACKMIYVTHIRGGFDCDVFFPSIPTSFRKTKESIWSVEGEVQYCFCLYQKS